MEVFNSILSGLEYTLYGLSISFAIKIFYDTNTILGKNNQELKDYMKHVYIIGQTGTGKTTFILNKIKEYSSYGSVVFIGYKDQKTIDDLLDTFTEEEKGRVIVIDPSHPRTKVGFNLFGNSKDSIKKELYVNSMIDTYKTIWGDAIGASSEDIFRMIGLGVSEMKVRTPLEIYRCMLEDSEDYREKIEKRTNNLIVKNFFKDELTSKIKNHTVMNPPKNKQRRIVSSPILLYTLCQSNPKFNLEKELNKRKIIIANFNQEKLGAENASFLAGLFFSQLQIIGFTRKNKTTPIFVVADEFQDYINSSFKTFLSQARSFNMSLTLSHQYTSQVPKDIQHAIDGNVASRYYFRVGKSDARNLSPFLEAEIDKEKLVNMKDYHYLREIIVNGKKQPMKVKKASKPPKTYGNRRYIIKNSLKTYGTSKREIDRDIEDRLGYRMESVRGGMAI